MALPRCCWSSAPGAPPLWPRATLGSWRCTSRVVTASVEAWVRQAADHSFDVIFADPPYELETTAVEDLLTVVLGHGWLAESGLVVVERSSRSSPLAWPAGLTPLRPRAYGETVLYFADR